MRCLKGGGREEGESEEKGEERERGRERTGRETREAEVEKERYFDTRPFYYDFPSILLAEANAAQCWNEKHL